MSTSPWFIQFIMHIIANFCKYSGIQTSDNNDTLIATSGRDQDNVIE